MSDEHIITAWWLIAIYAALVTFGIVAFAPKEVTYYYGSNECVYTHWIWHTDEKVFCPQDKGTLPEVVKQFNADLPYLKAK